MQIQHPWYLNSQALTSTLSTGPGVYQMRDAQEKVIYVGKARNLQKRVSSYFCRQLDTKNQIMMTQVHIIQTTITRNENEALLLEASFIKQFRPRYNVLLRDDKSYPYLYLSTHQKFPRLDFYRGSKKAPGRYFGPYPNVGSVRYNMALIQNLFKLRQCSESFFRNRARPCLQYQIKRCTAPCVGYVSEKTYRCQVDDTILFFEGKNERVIKKLTKQMEVTSANLAFEEAAHYRDQIRQLRRLQRQQVITGGKGNIDVIGVAQANGAISFAILMIRSGRVIGHKPFISNTPVEPPPAQTALAEFIPQYYLSSLRNADIPDRIVTSEFLDHRLWIQQALSASLNRKLTITANYKRAPYTQWQEIAVLNAAQALSQYLAQKNTFASKFKALQEKLTLSNPILRIECFDISHSLGEATVASCVVFGEEGPIKRDYRRFNIHGIKPGDDYGALRQALMRRYTRLKEGEGLLPDFLLIDGGIGQLRQAAEVFEKLELSNIILAAIAKGSARKVGLEKLFILERLEKIRLLAGNIAFHLMQQVRDEAHRFAIIAHRNARAKRRLESSLQQIKGVGCKRSKKLLNHFGGLQELQKANIEEIALVPGVRKTLAKLVYNACHRKH